MEKTRSYLPGKCRPFFFLRRQHTRARAGVVSLLRFGGEHAEERIESGRRRRRGGRSRGFCARRVPKERRRKAPSAVGLLDPLFFFIRAFLSSVFLCALLRRATRDVEKIRRRRRRHAISLFDGTKNRYRAFSKYNDKPGTGKTGYFDIPPNNYPFYMEEEK